MSISQTIKGGGYGPKELIDKFMTPREFQSLLNACNDRTQYTEDAFDLFWFLGNFGLRTCEVLDMKFEDFKLPDGYFLVRRRKKRKPKTDSIFLSRDEKQSLNEFLKRRLNRTAGSKYLFSFCGRQARYMFYFYGKRSGILLKKPKLSLHSLRHTCGLMLWESTRDIEFVRERLGHSNLKTVQIYIHMSPQRQVELAGKRKIIGW